jgi:hypothetical protein
MLSEPVFSKEVLPADMASEFLECLLSVVFIVSAFEMNEVMSTSEELQRAHFALDDGVSVNLHMRCPC